MIVMGILASLAIYLILQEPLDLKLQWWWVVAGAYCLAWIAGFLAFWAPGGRSLRGRFSASTGRSEERSGWKEGKSG